jgi:hypothetical protein
MTEQHAPAEPGPPDVPPAHDNPEVGHERSDANVSGVIRFAIGLFVFAVLAHLLVGWLLSVLIRRTERRQQPLTLLVKQEREKQQKEAEARRRKAVENRDSSPAPEPPLLYERMQSFPEPRLQISDKADLEALRKEEDSLLRMLAGVGAEDSRPRADLEREVLGRALSLLKGDSEAAQRLGLQRRPEEKKAGKGGR